MAARTSSNGTAYAVDVHANEAVRFDPGESTRYFLAQGIDPDSWDRSGTQIATRR